MDEIRKIDLENSSPSSTQFQSRRSRVNGNNSGPADTIVTMPTSRRKINFPKKNISVVLIALVVIFLLSFFVIVLPARGVYSQAKIAYAQAQKTWQSVKKQNIDQGLTDLAETKVQLQKTQDSLHGIGYLKFIPIASGYYSDADHLISAGFDGIDASNTLLNSLKPYQDVLGLKGKGSFVSGSAEQRIQTAVTTMGKITPQIDLLSGSLVKAKAEIDQVNPNHYPPIFGLAKVHDQLIAMKKDADLGVNFVSEARPLIKILPSLLGDPGEKKYLVIFQNDKELRPTGGFMTAYAIFRLDQGVIHVDSASDMYNLDNQVPNHPKAPEPILKYLPKVYTLNLRDANLSPDFGESMKTFQSLYNTIPGATKVDGIIAIDTHVLVSTIKVLDDQIYAGGILFTSQTDKRCNCPEAIYELESIADTPHSFDLRVSNVAIINAERKDIIGTLLFAIMEKALKSSPKKYWGPLVQTMLTETSQKHVQFNLFNADAQQGIVALNAAGKIMPFDGDYLAVNDTNFGGDKANLFTSEAVEQAYDVASDGTITKTVTVHYTNPYAPSDCNLERGNLCLNGDYRDWLRIYTPKGSQLVTSKGSEVTVTSSTDLDKTVFEGFLTVRPMGAATFTISYKLPFKVSNETLPLLMQKEGGTDGNQYTIKVKGNQVQQFNLETDKEVKLSL